MPAPEVHDLFVPGGQTAVLLPVLLVEGIPLTNSYGEAEIGPPQQIPVRWKWCKRQVTTRDGEVVNIDADVVVGLTILPGSLMWLGKLSDFLGTGSSHTNKEPELMEVVETPYTPDVKMRVARRTVSLKRYRGTKAQAYT